MPVINLHCHPPAFRPEIGRSTEAFDAIMRAPDFDLICMSPLDLRSLQHDPDYPFMTDSFTSDNESVAGLRDQYPEKVIPFVYVDPREPSAAETVRTWVEKEGFAGLKLYPPIGFYPDAPELVGFFELIDDLSIPILFHAGRVAPHPQLRCKYADPRYLEGVAYAVRKCSVLVGHAGNPWKEVTLGIAMGLKNVYIDITTGGGTDPDFVRRVVDSPFLGADRIVWGSDAIFGAIDKLHTKRRELADVGISPPDLDKIFGGTAARLLRL